LTGVKTLLDTAAAGLQRPIDTDHQLREQEIWSRAQRATFWNLAREDYLAAYINHTTTRLDVADIPLWQAAGLPTDKDGRFVSSSSATSSRMETANEDVISNTLVWMLARIMNFLAAGENRDRILALADMPTHLLSAQQDSAIARLTDRYAEWDELQCGVMDWFEKLPCTFRPCARVSRPTPEHDGSVSGPPLFSEIYFSVPMCAASVQHYHFARILLLLHQPLERLQGQSITDRFRRYRHISEEVGHHAREICGIALANPPGPVRIHMLQPLYLSGLCLEHRMERETILKLLRGIEAELGWTATYRVERLQADWSRQRG
jgi:hypothetical protein